MVDMETSIEDKELIPEKYPEGDLFLCDVADAVLKDVMSQMEHPFYSLSKKPDTTIRKYEHNGNTIEIIPSVKGLVTIYDKDILIYAISQIMAKINKGEPASKRVRINTHELLMFTNRGTGGRDYKAINDALIRLGGTQISTNIKTGDEIQTDNFGLIDASAIKRKDSFGRLEWMEVKLSDWVFNAIQAKEVLTLHRDYFRLRKPIERRMYELARKHCGKKQRFSINIDTLYKKTGTKSTLRKFKFLVKEIISTNHLPDYLISYDEKNKQVVFINRTIEKADHQNDQPMLKTETYEKAKHYSRGEDVYTWERDWIEHWIKTGSPTLFDPDKAFIGFCKSRYVRQKQEQTEMNL